MLATRTALAPPFTSWTWDQATAELYHAFIFIFAGRHVVELNVSLALLTTCNGDCWTYLMYESVMPSSLNVMVHAKKEAALQHIINFANPGCSLA